MAVYAIADLHLSSSKPKPMDIFGSNWTDHHLKIQKNWCDIVSCDDIVLVAGDISWAMSMAEFMPDLEFIKALPGKKIFVSGNHDYWWTSVQKLNMLSDDMFFIRTNFCPVQIDGKQYAVCGTRGWLCPNDTCFGPDDEKIYRRECGRLELSFQAAQKAGHDNFIAMLHYPPVNDKCERSEFQNIIEKYKAKTVVYGHLHSAEAHKTGISGTVNNVNYLLTSADHLDFKPILVYK